MISSGNIMQLKLPGNQVLVVKKNIQPGKNEMQPGRDEQVVNQLKKRDSEVRQHEAKHLANPDVISLGGINYNYTIGPDGKVYATGARVMVTTGPAHSPEEAMLKARSMKTASLSVGEPSNQDLAAAGSARHMELEVVNLKQKVQNKKPGIVPGIYQQNELNHSGLLRQNDDSLLSEHHDSIDLLV